MNIIEKVTEEDIGRIAISVNGSRYIVKILSASSGFGECKVQHLEGSPGVGVSNNFQIIGGHSDMMWKDAYSNPRRKNKPKKQPPKRKKTDATITYTNGKTYTLKNVESILCYVDEWDNYIYFTIKKSIGGIKSVTSIAVPIDTIRFIDFKSPSGKMSVIFYHEYVDIKDVDLTFTQKVDELNFIKRFK